uniref:o-succinylbenzoate synthase n=1 Tax=Cyanothece sp. (strain PCC 7425 / ATCC 29141) TaxID=395961 RepID=B8HVE1_CYAP4
MYTVHFQRCDRPFRPPLHTHHGVWSVRQSILVQLRDGDGRSGWGEIAPLSWFGSETLEQAWEFCVQLPTQIRRETIFSIPGSLPACQFGFESAWEALNQDRINISIPALPHCGLLPAGTAALAQWPDLLSLGYRTLKWKMGVLPIAEELSIFRQLCQELPTGIQLRLDANGGLSIASAHLWLQTCDPTRVEFLEQPLPPPELETMQELARQYSTPLALDESIANLQQLKACYQQGWQGIYVIKPAIAGSPAQLRQFLRSHSIDVVFSTVFEGAIGREAALKIAAEFAQNGRAVGFGIHHWFADSEPEGL